VLAIINLIAGGAAILVSGGSLIGWRKGQPMRAIEHFPVA
jgi:hypothetical protein